MKHTGLLLLGMCVLWALAGAGANAQEEEGQTPEAVTEIVEEVGEDAADAILPEDADAEEEDKGPTRQDFVELAKSMEPHFLTLEYTVKFDKGEAPYGSGVLPNSRGYNGLYLGYLLEEERPLEVPALLLSDTLIISGDPAIDARFLEKVVARVGDKEIPVKPVRYCKDQYAVIYELAEPVSEGKPLSFDPEAEGPYFLVDRGLIGGSWGTTIKGMSKSVAVAGDIRLTSVPIGSLIVTREGTPAGMCFNGDLEVAETWKTPPLGWDALSAEQEQELMDKTKTIGDATLLRVTLRFRSPKKQAGNVYGQEAETEMQVLGVLIDRDTVLVLKELPPKITARLERIQVHLPSDGGEDVIPAEATFEATLKDYGAFLAKLPEPGDASIRMSDSTLLEFRNQLLPSVELRIQGTQRTAYYGRMRILNYQLGWKKHIYPRVSAANEEATFLFDAAGMLLALPITKRDKTGEDRWGGNDPVLTPARYIQKVLASLDENTDPSNVPLTEEEENRLAWLGVVLQPLDEELARANNVSDETNNGSTGGLVSYVYPGSPADEAGIKPGYIMLRLHVEDRPKPIDVEAGGGHSFPGPFPWERLDEVPEQYYDQIPRPWPSAENDLTRTLTNLGFDKKFTVDFFHDGQILKKDFKVTQSPPHYDTAAKFKSEPLGLTVRNLSYELRRFFQRTTENPGVIVSKIEPGSKASVSGLKPYEIITHINDEPVMNVEDFEALVAKGGELKLAVKRWTRGRVVKVEIDGTEDGTASSDGEDNAAEDVDIDEEEVDVEEAETVEIEE